MQQFLVDENGHHWYYWHHLCHQILAIITADVHIIDVIDMKEICDIVVITHIIDTTHMFDLNQEQKGE